MDILADLKHSVRSLWTRPGFTLLVMLPLGLGIGANTAIFSAVHTVLLRSLPYKEPDRLVRVWEARPRLGPDAERMAAFSMDHLRAWREANEVFEGLAAHGNVSFNLTGSSEPRRIDGQQVTPVLFQILGVEALHGRTLAADEETPGRERVAVLSYGLWQRQFGADPGVVGDDIRLDGIPYTVVGVMPPSFRFPDSTTELWVPMVDAPVEPARPGEMRVELVPAIAKLAPGVTLEQAEAAGQAFLDNYRETSEMARRMDEGVTIGLTSLHEQLVRPVRPALLILFCAVALVLLIACANVADLLLVRAQSRGTEIAVRAALGAGAGRIASKLLLESLTYGIGAGILGILVAALGVRALGVLAPADLPLLEDVRVDGTVLAFNLGIALLTSVLVGIVPAFRAMKLDLVRGLKGLGTAKRRGRSPNLFAAAEVGLALVLLVAAGLMLRSFMTLTATDPGYEPRDTLTFRVSLPEAKYATPVARRSFFDALRESLDEIPDVSAAGLMNALPLDNARMITMLQIDGHAPVADRSQMPRSSVRVVSPDLFTALGMRLLRGEAFPEAPPAEGAPGVVVVNESVANRYFPDEDPIGKRLGPLGEIRGIVADVHQEGLDAEPEPEIYLDYRSIPAPMMSPEMSVVVRFRGSSDALLDAVEARMRDLDPELPLADVRPMEARLADSVARPRLYATLLSLFAALALLLAVSGVYAVISYAVSQRRREAGVRLAPGATPRDLFRLVLSDAFRILLLGLGVGLVASITLSRYLSSVLFQVSPFDPFTLVSVSLALVAAVVLASLLPARQSSRTDPVKALHYE